MAETADKGQASPQAPSEMPPPPKVRVGDVLKKEREQRRLSIEQIAKKLKLNARYLEALEANRYELLPGDPYVRVYLSSLAKFLSLNSETILRQFFDERGLPSVDRLRKDSSTKINLALKEKEKLNTTLIVAASLILLLALFSFFVNRQRWHTPKPAVMKEIGSAADSAGKAAPGSLSVAAPSEKKDSSNLVSGKPIPTADTAEPKPASKKTAPAAPDTIQPASAVKKVSTPKRDSVPLQAGKPERPKDSLIKAKAGDSLKNALKIVHDTSTKKTISNAGPRKPMKLRMTVTKDSVWARVCSDGKQWRNIVHKGSVLSFAARDSFNVLLGRSESVSCTIDDRPVEVPPQGVSSFKIDRSGVTMWSLEKWNSVFQGRF